MKLKVAEVGREKVVARRKEVINIAKQVAEASFKNALAQVQCVNPGLDLLLKGLHKDCEVHEGKVVVFSKDRPTFEIRAEPCH